MEGGKNSAEGAESEVKSHLEENLEVQKAGEEEKLSKK